MNMKNQTKFFEDLDFDIDAVCADDITNLGFYTFVIEPDGRRLAYGASAIAVREFREWPNGASDWENFKAACRKDWEER